MLFIAITAYALAMVVANLAVSVFGPAVTPLNSFLLIGLDLALRDWLQVRLRFWQMTSLVLAAGALTYGLNPAVGGIAVASAASFLLAAFVDWGVFVRARGSWLWRSMSSNIAGAAVDSVVFPTLAFGVLMPQIVALQFVAKAVGGSAWAWVFSRIK